MRVFSRGVLLFGAALIGLAQAASFEELATQLPPCGVSKSTGRGQYRRNSHHVVTMFGDRCITVSLLSQQRDMHLYRFSSAHICRRMLSNLLHG